MAIYILTGVLLLGFVMIMAVKGLEGRKKQQDSVLKQRAVFNLQEQLTYTRLKEILPELTVLVHISYDALLTTKLPHTRHKYRNMTADFVLLDQNHQVVSIIALDDSAALKRSRDSHYEDDLLRMAGYQVIRYDDVPEYQQLRQDFLGELQLSEPDSSLDQVKKYDFYTRSVESKIKAIS